MFYSSWIIGVIAAIVFAFTTFKALNYDSVLRKWTFDPSFILVNTLSFMLSCMLGVVGGVVTGMILGPVIPIILAIFIIFLIPFTMIKLGYMLWQRKKN